MEIRLVGCNGDEATRFAALLDEVLTAAGIGMGMGMVWMDKV
jgi:hypothetical protein